MKADTNSGGRRKAVCQHLYGGCIQYLSALEHGTQLDQYAMLDYSLASPRRVRGSVSACSDRLITAVDRSWSLRDAEFPQAAVQTY